MTTVAYATTVVSQVVDELNWDSRIDAARIHVSNVGGVIRLTGKVHNFAEKNAAQEAAHRVRGVVDVANDIEVVPIGTRTDADIAHAVRHALEWDVYLPHEQIQSTVSDAWVTLDGTVPYYFQVEDAAGAIRRLAGVRGVTNKIRVDPDALVPVAVHEAIRTALQRQAGREAERIDVEVVGGELTLSGRVRSWAEKCAIVGAAGHVPGILAVNDRVRIDP